MKKLLIGLCVLAISAVSLALLTDSGTIAANIASTTALTATYPISTTEGTPTPVTAGGGPWTDVIAVQNITITDNSVSGWTLTVTQSAQVGDSLTHVTNGKGISYTMQIENVAGTLGTGLTLSPAINTNLTFTAGVELISPTGTATTATAAYDFDLCITIAAAETVGMLAGNYVQTITLDLASDDV